MNGPERFFEGITDATQFVADEATPSRLSDWLNDAAGPGGALGRTQTFVRGSCIYAPGSGERELFLIEGGQVAIVLHDLLAGRCLTARLGPRALFGESAFGGRRRPEEALALSDVSVRTIDVHELLQSLNTAGMLELALEHLGHCLARSQAITASLLAPPRPAQPGGGRLQGGSC